MGMSEFHGPGDEAESLNWDTADMYGPFTNEVLVGEAIAGRRDQIVLATKFGNMRGADSAFLGVSGTPEYVHKSCDARKSCDAGQCRSDTRVTHPTRLVVRRLDGVFV